MAIRLAFGADPAEAANRLAELGVAVDVTGVAAVIGTATAGALLRAADQPWVIAIEEPRRLFPRA